MYFYTESLYECVGCVIRCWGLLLLWCVCVRESEMHGWG